MLHQPIHRTFSSTHFHNPTLPQPPNRQQKTPKRGKTLTYDTRETLTPFEVQEEPQSRNTPPHNGICI